MSSTPASAITAWIAFRRVPTGSIDNWRVVARPYSLEEQFSWSELPAQDEAIADAGGGAAVEALEDDVSKLLEEARKGLGGKAVAPHSASKPTVNLYNRGKPAIATVTGNYRLTDADADSDVRHIILDFGESAVSGAGRPEHRHRRARGRRRTASRI